MSLVDLSRGRHIKFTAERFNQIRNLLERGKNRQEIADIIGVTVNSLQVTCSRVGISLRPQKSSIPSNKKAKKLEVDLTKRPAAKEAASKQQTLVIRLEVDLANIGDFIATLLRKGVETNAAR